VNVVANQIFALIISAVRAALTDDVYHLFACALYCTMADDASFSNAQWIAARSKILTDISGIAGVFLEHLVYLLGKTGTTNLIRSAPDNTGDCSDCGCSGLFRVWTQDLVNPVTEIFPDEDGLFTVVQSGTPTGDGFYWIIVQFANPIDTVLFTPCNGFATSSGLPGFQEHASCHTGVDDPLSHCFHYAAFRDTAPFTITFTLADAVSGCE